MPPITTNQTNGKPYLRIVGGNFVRKVSEDYTPNPDESFRIREAKNLTTGEEINVPELVYINWQGKLERVEIVSKNFGTEDRPKVVRQLEIEMDDCVITVPTNTKYFNSLASALMLVDTSKPVLLHPYSMDMPEGKKLGVSVKQDGEKVGSYFYNFETKQYVEDYPKPDEKLKEKTGYWKMYYSEVEDYMCDKLSAHFKDVKPSEEVAEEVELDDLPF